MPAGHDQRTPRPADPNALYLAVGRGDLAALAAFYDATAPTIFGLLMHVIGEREPAAQAARRVYVQMWRLAPRFDPDHRSAYTLLLHTARRELASWLSAHPLTGDCGGSAGTSAGRPDLRRSTPSPRGRSS